MADAGWYQDPTDSTKLRWFDGAGWTAEQRDAPGWDEGPGEPSTGRILEPPSAAPGPSRRRVTPKLAVMLAAGVLTLLIGTAVAVAVVGGRGSGDAGVAARQVGAERASSSTVASSEPTQPTAIDATTLPPSTTAPLPPAVTEIDLRNLYLPEATCSDFLGPELSRQLVEGRAEVHVDGFPEPEAIEIDQTLLVDISGDGVGDGVAVTLCTNGGSSVTFDVAVLVAGAPAPIRVPIGVGVESYWELDFGTMTVEGSDLHVQSYGSTEGDSHADNSKEINEVFRWNGGAFDRAAVDVQPYGAPKVGRDFMLAWSAGDVDAMNALAPPDVVRTALGFSPPSGEVTCAPMTSSQTYQCEILGPDLTLYFALVDAGSDQVRWASFAPDV